MAGRTRRTAPGIVAGDGGVIDAPIASSSIGDVDSSNLVNGPDLGGPVLIDPTTLGGGSDGSVSGSGDTVAGGTDRRGPGAPRGPRGPRKGKASLTVGGIEKLLFGIHYSLAKVTNAQHWALDHEESKMLAEALAAVQSHYPALEIPPQYIDIGALFSVATAVYGPRIFVGRVKAAKAKREAMQAAPAQPMQEAIIIAPGPAAPAGVAQPAQPANDRRHNVVDIPGLGIVNLGPRRMN